MKYIFIILTCILFLSACKKDWLDVKPNKSLVVPSTSADYQALLDNTMTFGIGALANVEAATNDYVTTLAIWQSRSTTEQGLYLWSSDPHQGVSQSVGDWADAYSRILQENIVLQGIESIKTVDAAYNNVKGSALFYRAYDFFNLSQEFCKPFSARTAATDLGIPLRLTDNVNDRIIRSSVSETYNQIISDLKTSKNLLPQIPLYKTRPSVPAAYAMLARVYLSMEDYDNAGLYADSCLQITGKLIDYNTLNTASARPFTQFNDETIFEWQLGTYNIVRTGTIVPELYQSYSSNDLRLTAFYTTAQIFKGSYTGSSTLFNGLATDEIYLIRSECRARTGKVSEALSDLNALLIKRYKAGNFTAVTASDANDALGKVLNERRKELVYRGLRWSDLRRLNKDSRFATTLTRTLNGVTYTLPPNDLRYIFLIPQNEVLISGIEQNPR